MCMPENSPHPLLLVCLCLQDMGGGSLVGDGGEMDDGGAGGDGDDEHDIREYCVCRKISYGECLPVESQWIPSGVTDTR